LGLIYFKYKKMKKEYIIGALVGAVVVLAGVVCYLLLTRETAVPNSSEQLPAENTDLTQSAPANDNQNKNLKTYRGSSFEFQYPSNISLVSKGETVTLAHAVPYRHTDLCDMRDGARPLDKITDFDVALQLYKKSLNETVRANIPENMIQDYFQGNSIKVSPGFIDDFKSGNLKGYKITEGVEGCGVYKYYLPLSANATLYLARSFVPEFNPINTEYQKYLNVPGVIPPEQEEKIFQSILSSFKIN